MASNQIQQIKKLKEKLENQKMSVLVGAGFSKNVSTIFPSWWELLFDAAYFLYGNDIVNAYMTSNVSKTITKKDYIKQEISKHIDTVGYLDLVSEYIKRNGIREAITTYIEHRTPKISLKAEKISLRTRIGNSTKKIEITNEDLKIHRLLLGLQWNNIYTTNYDELLEISSDKHSEKVIRDEIKFLENEVERLFNLESQILAEISLETDDRKKQYLNSRLDFNVVEIKRKEKDLIKFNGALSECISVVSHSAHLSLKRNKNIIKLHGTLRGKKSSFGFDNDLDKTYVIAKEDYESYPLKHEAFTQLMRISLLQESYCLVGFSGVDPNFVEWVKWVRDILQKKATIHRKSDYKIYLIDVGGEEPDADKLLFFENYSICRISLADPNVNNFLQSETQRFFSSTPTKKELLELLLVYLADGKSYSIPKTTVEKIYQNKYRSIWDSLSFYKPEDIDWDTMIKKTEQLELIAHYSRIPSNSFSSNSKLILISRAQILLKITATNPDRKNALLQLVALAVKNTFSIVSEAFKPEILDEIYKDREVEEKIKNTYRELSLRLTVLENDKKKASQLFKKVQAHDNNFTYHKILTSLFNLEFQQAKSLLAGWDASSHWILKKIGLLALLNISEAESELELFIGSMENQDVQEQLYFFQMLRFIKQSRTYTVKKNVQDRISDLENLGFRTINENLENILKETIPKAQKLNRYGAERFTTSNSFKLSYSSKQGDSIAFIQILIESGFPLMLSNTYLISSENWYTVFSGVFEYLPFPCLFYSLQYSEEKFLGRVAQDYINSPHLVTEVNEILPKLLEAYLENPDLYHFRKSALYFSSELFIAVDPKLWELLFFKIWKDDDFRKFAFDDRRNENHIFINAALPYIKSLTTLRSIVTECIDRYEETIANDFLYKLHKNELCFDTPGFQVPTMKKKIDSLIRSLATNGNTIYIIGNIFDILTDKQRNEVTKQIESLDFKNLSKEYSWKNVVYFAKNNPKLLRKIKQGILKNPALWNSGFKGTSISSGIHHINLEEIRYRDSHPNGLKWSKSECVVLYDKLKMELSKVEQYFAKYPNRDAFINFSPVLEEMFLFLNGQELLLKDSSDFGSVHERVANLVIERKGYSDILEGLVSNEKSEVIKALSDLFFVIEDKINDLNLPQYINTLLNKILLQSEPGVEASIHYVSEWMKEDDNWPHFEAHKRLLLAILDKYNKKPLSNADVPFVHRKLVSISNTLLKRGFSDVAISKWQEIKEGERYFNLKSETRFS